MRLFFRYLYISVPIAIVFCVVGQMIISNQMIVYGNDLGKINARIRELHEQNDYLEKQLVQQQSIKRISAAAKNFGFVEATNYVAFTSDSFPIAIKR